MATRSSPRPRAGSYGRRASGGMQRGGRKQMMSDSTMRKAHAARRMTYKKV